MLFDAVIQQALKGVHGLLVDNIAPTRGLSDERAMVCLNAVLGKESVPRALEKANDTAPCFALREVKYVLDQRQRPKTTINQLWCIIEQLNFSIGIKQEPRMIPQKKRPTSRPANLLIALRKPSGPATGAEVSWTADPPSNYHRYLIKNASSRRA